VNQTFVEKVQGNTQDENSDAVALVASDLPVNIRRFYAISLDFDFRLNFEFLHRIRLFHAFSSNLQHVVKRILPEARADIKEIAITVCVHNRKALW